ncbi:glycerate kinase [Subdoligranulum variabile]|uniref:glycerate kinase type-2 family protein n=1 Tax=Subdoligranulum variabile TaxID=214851 RepID=UPI00294201A0|nr:glycerate kinase [Subdoligranulum variabile]
MNRDLRTQADAIVSASIAAVLPDRAVRRALAEFVPGPGKTMLVAAGKAAWQMAHAAVEALGHVDGGVVVTKYDHVKGEIPGVTCYEAGHPVPDENSFSATARALELVQGLTADDTVLFLLSGGGSALFEKPLIPGDELQDITRQLLASGADIVEMNTIRKRLSAVKGGRFGQACAPAKVYSIVLSDILGDPLDMIASGPAYPDSSTCEQARAIAARYGLSLSPAAQALLAQETPKTLDNVTTRITGSVRELCAAAAEQCRKLGYEPLLLSDCLDCEAREAGRFLADVLRTHAGSSRKLAFLAGGETVVHLTGKGLGGRNQELALAAAPGLQGLPHAAVFSVGSDGTDGPTDAAGGYVDGTTMQDLQAKGLDVFAVLQDNDAYHALQAVDGLIVTGPTGTNVNDVAVALLDV